MSPHFLPVLEMHYSAIRAERDWGIGVFTFTIPRISGATVCPANS